MSHNYYEQIKNYEKSNGKARIGNKNGVVYTEPKIAIEMVEQAVLTQYQKTWEPSCGAGTFLIAILDYMKDTKKLNKRDMKKYVENNLDFSDINAGAVGFSIFMVKQYLKQFYGINTVKINGRHEDALLNNRVYDVIIGNPPYIREKDMKKSYLSFLKNNYKSCQKGNTDIYYAFMELACKYGRKSCLITPNTYLKNASALSLRERLSRRISLIRDYKEIKVFPNASVYTAITVIEPESNADFYYAERDEPARPLNRDLLRAKKWYLSNNSNSINYEARTTKLSDIANIYSTIQTGANDYYKVKTCSRVDGFYFQEFNGKPYPVEVKACLKLKNLSKYFGDDKQADQAIIFPYDKFGSALNDLAFIDQFPFAYRYLLDIKDSVLNKRDNGKTSKYETWSAYSRKQNIMNDFTGKACTLIPNVYREDNFEHETIISKERFFALNGYVVVAKEGHEELVKQIMGDPDFKQYLLQRGRVLPGKAGGVNFNKIDSTLIKNYPFLMNTSITREIVNNVIDREVA